MGTNDTHEGWRTARDGRMADYTDMSPGAKILPYDPQLDPVNQGKVESPYSGGGKHASD